MARCTSRGAQVATDGHGLMVHASAVFFELVRWNGMALHVGSIGMTASAGFSDVERVNVRTRVTGRTHAVDAMAVDANRDFGVTFGGEFSVNTGLVLNQLIGAQGRVVLTHEGAVGVATSAQGGYLTALNLSTESRRLAHGVHVGHGGIAAMATGAGKAFLRMNILSELFFRYAERRVERGVAIEASVRRLGARRQAGACRYEQQQNGP